VIGITDEDNPTAVNRFISKMEPNMDYTVAIDSEGTAYNGTYSVIAQFLT